MFGHLEYLLKKLKLPQKKQKKQKKQKPFPLSKDRNLVRLSLLGTPAYTAPLTQMRASWRLPEKVKSHELKFHQ